VQRSKRTFPKASVTWLDLKGNVLKDTVITRLAIRNVLKGKVTLHPAVGSVLKEKATSHSAMGRVLKGKATPHLRAGSVLKIQIYWPRPLSIVL